jgi:hypothetical protein
MIFFPVELEKAVLIFSLIMCVGLSFADANNCGEKFSTRMDQDVFTKHRLRSRVIESQPINRPLECHVKCMKNCRCLSYNACNGGKLCELNSKRKENNISLYEQSDACDYHEYEFTKLVSNCLSSCLSSVRPSVRPSVRLFLYLFVCLHACSSFICYFFSGWSLFIEQ